MKECVLKSLSVQLACPQVFGANYSCFALFIFVLTYKFHGCFLLWFFTDLQACNEMTVWPHLCRFWSGSSKTHHPETLAVNLSEHLWLHCNPLKWMCVLDYLQDIWLMRKCSVCSCVLCKCSIGNALPNKSCFSEHECISLKHINNCGYVLPNQSEKNRLRSKGSVRN